MLGVPNPCISWTRGLTSTPYCCLGLRAPEHALQTSMMWAARRCRRDMGAIMEVIYPRCAGLDVHKQTVVACARIAGPGPLVQEVRTFATATAGLLELADWLESFGVEYVAMEATGVYWKPVWHVLEGHFELVLANASHVKNVPGRKTDVSDSMWLADLLAHGLIRASFVPPVAVQELRTLTRTRKQFVRERASHVQRIEKVLEDANIKITSVLSDILGKSGRAVLQALIDGQSDPQCLTSYVVGNRLKASRAEQTEALSGRVRAHHRFMLKLHLGPYRRPGQGDCRHREGGRPGARAVSTSRQVAEHDARLESGQRQRGGRRDRHRHVALCNGRPPAVMGLPVPAQRRERRQAAQHATAPWRYLAQDHPGASGLGRSQGQGQLPAGAVPSNPRSPWRQEGHRRRGRFDAHGGLAHAARWHRMAGSGSSPLRSRRHYQNRQPAHSSIAANWLHRPGCSRLICGCVSLQPLGAPSLGG